MNIKNKSNHNKEELHLVFEDVAGMEILTAIFRFTESFCADNNISAKTMHRLNLVLEELTTNMIKFGFRQATQKKITIHVSNFKDFLQLELFDTGAPFDTPKMIAESKRNFPDEMVVGKRGLILIGSMTFDFSYHRMENQNINKCKIKKQ